MLHFFQTGRQPAVCTLARDGTLLAEHSIYVVEDPEKTITAGWQDGSLLAAGMTDETLYVCSAGGQLQAVSLDRLAEDPVHKWTLTSSCGAMAAVCIIGALSEVLIVDLAQQLVTFQCGLPDAFTQGDDFALAQTRCNLAFSHRVCEKSAPQTTVLAVDGAERFVLAGTCSPSWDLLGRSLAVVDYSSGMYGLTGISVYDVSGCVVARVDGLPRLEVPGRVSAHVRWQPERCELVWSGQGRTLIFSLRSTSGLQLTSPKWKREKEKQKERERENRKERNKNNKKARQRKKRAAKYQL